MTGINILHMTGGGFKKQTGVPRILDYDNGLVIHLVRASVTLERAGGIQFDAFRMNLHPRDAWFSPPIPNRGDTVWVKAIREGGSLSDTKGLVINTLYQLNTNRTWYVDNDEGGLVADGIQDIDLRFDFFLNNLGTGTPVFQYRVSLEREWAI